MKDVAELQALLERSLPGARLKIDSRTGGVTILTGRYVKAGDQTQILVTKAEREADYTGKGKEYVIELASEGFGRDPGNFYFVEDGEDYTTDINAAKRFSTRKEAEQVIEDAGNMMDEDEPRVKIFRKK